MFLPYKVDVPMQRWPIANWVLIALTCLISFAMFGPLGEWADSASPIANLPPKLVQELHIEGLTIERSYPPIVDSFLLQPQNFHVAQLLGNLFIHANFLHLAGNMLFLFVFGNAINAKLGHLRFIALYMAVGVVESIVWVLTQPHSPCLGASGAIMGIIGAFLILYPLNNVSVAYCFTLFYRGAFEISAMWVIAVYLAFDVWGVFTGHGAVAYLAHITGTATGLAAMAGMLWLGWVTSDRMERNLLQVLGWLPEASEDDAPAWARTSKIATSQGAMVPKARPQRVAPQRDQGPIPLD